jgi:hypothetical protein
MAVHTGQSSQLFPVATGRNAQFLATIYIGINVSRTGASSHGFIHDVLTPNAASGAALGMTAIIGARGRIQDSSSNPFPPFRM